MRILIAGPAKAGNVWAKCMIAHALGLRPLATTELPEGPRFPELKEWLDAGKFPDETIFHQHYAYLPELADKVDAVPAHLVTVVRDPYDAFVSAYYSVQTVSGRRPGRSKRTSAILNAPLDSDAIYEHLRSGGWSQNMKRASEWIQSGRSTIVRYEGLHNDPVAELQRVAEAVGRPVAEDKLIEAIDGCSADRMRQQGGATAKHVRSAKVGDSREKLNDKHLAIFRELHSDLIRSMGYDVR
jgi:hypothetical protein